VKRLNPWLYEVSGALNPAWVYLGVLLFMECFAVVMAFLRGGATIQIVSCSLLGVTINVLAMASVSQSKAAILANATSSGEIAKGITSGLHFGGSTEEHDPGTPLR